MTIIHFPSSIAESPAVRIPRLPLPSCVLLLALAAAPAWAQRGPERGPPRAGPDPRQRDSLSESVRRVQRDTRGQVLGAERVPFDGREMHRVKVLDDRGRVRVYMDDPGNDRGPAPTRGERRPPPGRPLRGNDD